MSIERMKAMITIVDRGDGIALAKLYEQNGVGLHLQVIAEGTATSEVLDMLGLSHREKEVLVSFAPESAIANLLSLLDDDYRGILSVRGLAFSLPLTGISSSIAMAISNESNNKGGAAVHNDKEYNLICVAVNHGYSDQIMHTACQAGATGGTVIRSRWVGAEKMEQFHGITLQDEKEVIMIACAKDKRNAIMDAINKEHGLKSEQQASVFSMPIDRVVKLS